jgi:diacylglycerol kinase (ATP)
VKVALIINPAAGNGRGAKAGQKALRALNEKGVTCTPLVSEYPGHALRIAEGLQLAEFDIVVCVGGDGTVFEVINGLLHVEAPSSTTIGVIPVGSGNSFSQDLGVFGDFEGAVEAVVRNHPRSVDVAWFTTNGARYYFANMLGFGFVSDVCHAAVRYKALRHLSYVIGVFQITASLSHYMAPQASIDDGLLDIVILNRISRRKLLWSFPRIFRGAHLELPEVETFRGRHIIAVTNRPKVLTPDGELLGSTPIEVGILPGRLQVVGKWSA